LALAIFGYTFAGYEALLIGDMVHKAAVDSGTVDGDGEAWVLGDLAWIAAPPSERVERDLLDQVAYDRGNNAGQHP